MFCTNCGKEIDDGSVFCTNCGTRQTVEQPASLDTTNVENTPITEDVKIQNNNEFKSTPQPKPIVATNVESASVKNNKNFKFIIGIVAVVIVIAIALTLGNGGGHKEYKDLINDYYSAIYKEDFNALLKCYDKEDQKDMKDEKDDIKEVLEEKKEIYDDKFDKGWNKKVEVKSRSRVDSEDGVTIYNVSVTIDDESAGFVTIKKYKERYYIDSDNDIF